ncbi:multiple monosaccharide ABC transporter substrate-binding protein [Actinotignum urinale]|uniref:Multiple monosaccharide ABC transporter substrate-binding protein n=1 Tax=Actinotignum urinale TaxID=190146 RepID=A0AAW9HN85_9ACTO|nr:multiple monosaccharide ABC transporter substrate-binding protein [Actinotignum urinale]MDY5133501.1 multiple monosaccharide ABC transporter substrate-binding protein [Actinotignum urinale]MDY5155346.1 multiple monosaccharide ABC transporter substrate-binding protein [Actinotignum urinale]MDY5160039.1 multiple monosaccharide ABC transporter substrate-binding protein [Actinotignum urinale]WIK58844.1 sugar ABC transporter substrate-binding protein [Actinotignum urinale]
MKKSLRLTFALLLSLLLVVATVTGCSSVRARDRAGGGGKGSGKVGISMPSKSLERWARDGDYLRKVLKEKGYTTSMQYADNKVEQQISQIQNMINEGPEVIIVASIDGSALGPVLSQAKQAGIKVIAYDRLIRDTDAISYYVTFDNYKVGQAQGQYIEKALGLKEGKGPFNFEPFSGSPDDNNARYFFEGAWDVLKPYIDKGQLKVPSNKMPKSVNGWQSIGIQAWMGPAAQSEMETRLNSFYRGGTKVNAILAPNDALALGITQALKADGYTQNDWPVLTGQDADQANVTNIMQSFQSMTVWKDTRKLADQAAKMTDQIIKKQKVEVNDEKSYNNGVFVVPTFLLEPVVITKDNAKEKLVDSGYYSAGDIGIK